VTRKPGVRSASNVLRWVALALVSTMTMPWHLTAAGEDEAAVVEAPSGDRAYGRDETAALAAPETQERARLAYFTDLPLTTQDGKTVRFYTDVLKNKVVLIHFLFTNCPGVCPIQAAKLAELQGLLGDRMGDRVRFVSISIDPDRDTPAALRTFGERFGAGKGWMFLTGAKENVATIARKLGNTSPDVEAHLPVLLLANVATGDWIKMRPDASAKALAAELLDLLDSDETGG